jgi:hypothetical protein
LQNVAGLPVSRSLDAMAETSDAINYRIAVGDDEPNILALFKEVAPEIPVSLDEPEAEAKMITEIVQRRGGTWVALTKVVKSSVSR